MKKNKGITLVALIITIIVMLILVAVSVRLIINSNILGTAKEAGDKYKEKQAEESNLSKNKIMVDDETFDKYIEKITGEDNEKLITFTIKCVPNNMIETFTGTAIEGWTWAQFVKSEYCPKNFFYFDNTDYHSSVEEPFVDASLSGEELGTSYVYVSDQVLNLHKLDDQNESTGYVSWTDEIISGQSYGYY